MIDKKSEGLITVLSGPSGAGKGTVLKRVLEIKNDLKLSISATTRKPRNGEKNGVNYFFKTNEEFEKMINQNELVEWVEYCGNYYGTPMKYLLDLIYNGIDVILELEVNGALKIKKSNPECILIFITPPSFNELKKRIKGRGTESNDVIKKRLSESKEEFKQVNSYDYLVVNDNLNKAVSDVISIINAEKLKTERNNKFEF